MGIVPPPSPGIPEPPFPPAVLIWALSIAWVSMRALLVKSCSRSTFTSNDKRNAWSFDFRTRCRNSLPACCSRGSTSIWLPEVSSRIPSVSGRCVSAVKFFRVWGTLSSATEQSSLVRCGTSCPDLFLTVKNRSTRFTFSFSVPVDSSSGAGGGAVLTGGASGEGTSCPQAAALSRGSAKIKTKRVRETRMLLSWTRKPDRKRAQLASFPSLGANLQGDDASDTLTGAASIAILAWRVRLRANNRLAQCRMGRKNTCGPRFQSTGAYRIPEFVPEPQSGGFCPDSAAIGPCGSAVGSGCSRSPGAFDLEGHWPADPRDRFYLFFRFKHFRGCPPAGARNPASSVPDKGHSDRAARFHDSGRHRVENYRQHDLCRGPGHGEGHQG